MGGFQLLDIYSEIALILFIASIVGALSIRMKQPLIVGFIAVGILLGPATLGWVNTNDQINLLAKLGISLLLFIVGLKLDLHIIKRLGPVALATGIGQVLFTSLIGYLIALSLDFNHLESLYIAVALTFSSTIIIIKLLSDKREVDSLHGRIAVGFLIVQDILVIVAMIALNALSAADTSSLAVMTFLRILFSGLLFLVLVALLMRYALTPFLNFLAQSKELLVLFSIAWAVSLAAIGYSLGLSKEVGAFVAGVSLASTPFREVIGSKLTTLRDFLLLFFFVDLGAALDFSAIGSQVQEALLFSLFVVVGNPLIVMIIMGVMGYRKRTGFLAGLTVAQISEFSLILAALGMSLGHIHAPVLGLITLVGLITISASTYLILYSHTLYSYLCNWLDVFERQIPYRELADLPAAESRIDIVVFGLGQFGRTIVDLFKSKGYRVLAIDFDPEVVRKAQAAGIDAHYGDAEDAEFIATLPLEHARWIVSAMHDQHPSLALQQTLKAQQYPGNIIFAVKENKQRETLLENGGMVFVVHEYAAQHVAQELLNLDMSG